MPQLLDYLNRYPPCFCRVVARDERGRPLTTKQIARRGGLAPSTVDRNSPRRDWTGVPIETIDRYFHGCRINPFQLRRHVQFFKRLRRAGRHHVTSGRHRIYFARLDKAVGAKARAKTGAQKAESQEA